MSRGYRFLGILGGLLLVALLRLHLSVPQASTQNSTMLHEFWPRFPRPKTVLTTDTCSSNDMSVVQQTLAGLVSHAAREGRCSEAVWMTEGHPAYPRWLAMMLKQTGARKQGPFETWTLVDRYRKQGIVKGYILYRADDSKRAFHELGPMDTSVNVATSMCALLGGVAVSTELEAEARTHGLEMLLDAGTMTEEQCFSKYRDRFNRRVLAELEPKTAMTRAETVAMGAFAVSQPGPLYEQALEWLTPDSPMLGWAVGDESLITSPSSRWGDFQTGTNWLSNLALMSTEKPGVTIPRAKLRQSDRKTLWDIRWEDNVHYASFMMSDGDNVQWQMANFLGGEEDSWWANRYRGQLPMGWSCCYVDLAQVCPYALEYLLSTAKPNDDFILMSGGYYYPDLFGSSRPGSDLLRLHASRIGEYMRMGGIRLISANTQDIDSKSAIEAYNTYAREIPDLLGMMMYQYSPYTAGKGSVVWVKDKRGDDVPVVACRYAIWGKSQIPEDGPPGKVANMLNAMPHDGAPTDTDHFSWVMVHAWSYFKRHEPGGAPETEEVDQSLGKQPEVERGLSPVKWCVEDLQSYVRVVTPTELMLQMRLRLRPQQTLSRGLADLKTQCGKLADATARRDAQQLVTKAEKELSHGGYRQAFEDGKHGYNVIAKSHH